MIGYRISRGELGKLIEAEKPGWMDRAEARTAEFRAKGAYEESSSIWSEVKPVYMRLQGGSKCAFCERKLEAEEYGKGEQAVEHFRPKGNVRAWKASAGLVDEGVKVSAAPSKKGGYYLLPYDIFNYSAACIPCNSALKGDQFPVAGRYNLAGESPEVLAEELPLLLYPIADFDADPENLIQFHGVSPSAVAAGGHERHRALVTIDFFQLDSISRDNLIRERAMVIAALFPALQALQGPAKKAWKKIVDGLTGANSAHCNCARSFRRLFERNPMEAEAVFERASELLESKS